MVDEAGERRRLELTDHVGDEHEIRRRRGGAGVGHRPRARLAAPPARRRERPPGAHHLRLRLDERDRRDPRPRLDGGPGRDAGPGPEIEHGRGSPLRPGEPDLPEHRGGGRVSRRRAGREVGGDVAFVRAARVAAAPPAR